MSAGVVSLVGRLRVALGPEAADADLLRAYAHGRDADAFAALVRRHGPRVWAVCRRAVGDRHAAEDAFQAVFLVLARRAAGLAPADSLGGWLHVVAMNVSLRARTAADRRKRREVSGDVDTAATPSPEPPDERALAALDEALARLPAKLRDAVVLCELDGLSRRDAAERLGVPEGTLSSRLSAARKRLAERLRERGVRPEMLALPVAAVPSSLAEAACGLGAGTVPAPAVAALAGGTMRALLLKGLAAGVVACGLMVAGGLAKDDPPAKPGETPQVTKSAAVRQGVILITTFGRKGEVAPVERFLPNGFPLSKPDVGELTHLWQPRVSPDGTKLLAAKLGPLDGAGPFTPNRFYVLMLGETNPNPEQITPIIYHLSAVWSRNGRQVYGSSILPAVADVLRNLPRENLRDDSRFKTGEPLQLGSWVYDLATNARTPLAVPDGHQIVDLSPDGTTLLTTRPKWQEGYPTETYTIPLATMVPKRLTEAGFEGWRFSPDGRRVLGRTVVLNGVDKPPVRVGLGVVPTTGGPVTDVQLPEEVRGIRTACWSPDGRQIAYAWSEAVPWPNGPPTAPLPIGMEKHPDKTTADRISIADADGQNPKVIARREADGGNIQGIDWR